jgi:hypothetical protein
MAPVDVVVLALGPEDPQAVRTAAVITAAAAAPTVLIV